MSTVVVPLVSKFDAYDTKAHDSFLAMKVRDLVFGIYGAPFFTPASVARARVAESSTLYLVPLSHFQTSLS